MTTLSRGLACDIPNCGKFATHEESSNQGVNWYLRCDDHCHCVRKEAK